MNIDDALRDTSNITHDYVTNHDITDTRYKLSHNHDVIASMHIKVTGNCYTNSINKLFGEFRIMTNGRVLFGMDEHILHAIDYTPGKL